MVPAESRFARVKTPTPEQDLALTPPRLIWGPERARFSLDSSFEHFFPVPIRRMTDIEGIKPSALVIEMCFLCLVSVLGLSTSERLPYLYFNLDAQPAVVYIYPDQHVGGALAAVQ